MQTCPKTTQCLQREKEKNQRVFTYRQKTYDKRSALLIYLGLANLLPRRPSEQLDHLHAWKDYLFPDHFWWLTHSEASPPFPGHRNSDWLKLKTSTNHRLRHKRRRGFLATQILTSETIVCPPTHTQTRNTTCSLFLFVLGCVIFSNSTISTAMLSLWFPAMCSLLLYVLPPGISYSPCSANVNDST